MTDYLQSEIDNILSYLHMNPWVLYMPNEPLLPPKMVEGAIRHMNEDHAHNLLGYAHVLAGLPWAEDVEMSGLDAEGFDLIVHGGGQIQHARIAFDTPLTDAKELRPALVALAAQARRE